MDTALVLVILVLLVVGATITGIPHRLESPALVTISVQQGDTIWGLAEKYPAPGLRTEETVDLLIRVNSLGEKMLLAGSTVQVPASSIENRLALKR
ncbi:MAG: LysM peptidoglycan-binding domain-containing protein [Nitrospirae bacterium]|nr:LysM peptidoglycan-binding domain-containing protein [Coriobacteriia bacterium]NTW67824.1 LysM peptidoglycan-binding domain-containing protein [Nitrospirota bacterium]